MLNPFIGFEFATSNLTVPESYYNEKRRRSKHIFFLFLEKAITFFFFLAALDLRCGAEACGILVPWPGIELASLALEGGFLTTETPGKFSGEVIWPERMM